MSKAKSKEPSPPPPEPPPAAPEPGLALDELSQALQSLFTSGDDPYTIPATADEDPLLSAANTSEAEQASTIIPADESNCELGPRSILEALLFVGTPENQPLSCTQLAGLMRGVSIAEVDDLITELNACYRAANCPYRIESIGDGYRMTLADAWLPMREALFGRVRPARLSPAAIDTLSIVAYNQPATAEQVEKLRGTPSGAILSQLVRRQFLRVERQPEKPRVALYRTTERFLSLLGLESLDDLPKGLELEQ
jgi:segregation and condensation protein B